MHTWLQAVAVEARQRKERWRDEKAPPGRRTGKERPDGTEEERRRLRAPTLCSTFVSQGPSSCSASESFEAVTQHLGFATLATSPSVTSTDSLTIAQPEPAAADHLHRPRLLTSEAGLRSSAPSEIAQGSSGTW